VALFLAYGLILVTHWSAVTAGMIRLYDPSQYTLGFVVLLYAVAGLIFLAHELGHGLTCKHFGGEVHEIGAMLFYFSPAFFCNINDAWNFEKLSQRLWVTFAGSEYDWISGISLAMVGGAAILLAIYLPMFDMVNTIK
jgi:putative peptide zinc metalloprotease protein